MTEANYSQLAFRQHAKSTMLILFTAVYIPHTSLDINKTKTIH